MYPRIAYVTYRGDLPDPDLPLALAALRAARLDAEAVVWDDDVDWGDFDLVVVRSTWDYSMRRPEFLRWARGVEEVTRLANPVRCLVKNTDKTYLRQFAAHGIPTIPTVWFEPGDDRAACADLLAGTEWTRFVVKPNIGDGVFSSAPLPSAQEAATVAAHLAARGLTALIQPYLSVVERSAELSVVVLGGVVSHAVTRIPSPDGPAQVSAAAVPVDVAETVREILALTCEEHPLLYARVDLIPGADGWLVMEFEATEPRLFLDAAPDAATRFARAVRAVVSPTD